MSSLLFPRLKSSYSTSSSASGNEEYMLKINTHRRKIVTKKYDGILQLISSSALEDLEDHNYTQKSITYTTRIKHRSPSTQFR